MLAFPVDTSALASEDGDATATRVSDACGAADLARMPDTVQIDGALRRPVQAMLRQSPTFREQCRRVAVTRLLYVRVRLNGTLVDYRYRARTRIRRFVSGVIIAEVEIRPPGPPEEWIAHEFEHVLEQVDRVPIVELAGKSRGVWRTAEQMFETERAIRAGRAVAGELRRRIVKADGFVD
jgi:hypothetical protein